MSSKSRGGLSKREFAAKQKASSKISSSSKKSTSSSSSSKYAGPSLPGQVKSGYYDYSNTAKVAKDAATNKSKNESDSKSPSYKKSTPVSTPTTNRTLASGAYNATGTIAPTPTGIKGAITSGVSAARNWLGDLMGNYGQMIGNNGLNQASANLGLSDSQRQNNINSALGIQGANASVADLGDVLYKSVSQDQPTGYGPNGETYYNDYDPSVSGGSMFQSDFGKGYSRPGSELASSQGISPISYGNTQRKSQENYGSGISQVYSPKPTQVNTPSVNPFSNPLSQGNSLSNAYSQLLAQTDRTPTQGVNGTVRRPKGMGEFSKGQYANGAGGYGLGGGFNGGNSMDNEQNILNQLLGIQTANAQETGLEGTPSYDSYMGGDNQINNGNDQISYLSNLYDKGASSMPQGWSDPNSSYWSDPQAQQSAITNSLANDKYASMLASQQDGVPDVPQDNMLASLMQMSGLGNTAQASGLGNIMGSIQGESSNAFDDSTYKKQKKEAEKANKEYLKSIERQYAEAQTSGTADLEKAKQQDLLKLGAQFNFGNSDPNDEQRIQYQTRTTNDYAGQVADLIKKLASAKSTDQSTAFQNLQEVLQGIQAAKQAQQQKVAEIQRQQQQQQFENAYKIYGLKNTNQKTAASYAPDGSYTYGETDPVTGKKIFYDKQGNGFYNS